MSDDVDPKRVVVIDDDALVLRVMVRLLTYQGRYRVQAFASAAEALPVLAAEPCDLLITDLKMRGADGLAVITAARKHHPTLPAILVTGNSTDEIAERIRFADVTLVRKPFTLEGLLAAVSDSLGE
jgi:two-component system cell cycle sensor histidine kinase/response regulator CckA